MRSLTSSLRIISSLLALVASVHVRQCSACPSYTLDFRDESTTCQSLDDFNTAYEQLYKGLQSYLELRSFSSEPTTLLLQDDDNKDNNLQLQSLSRTSWSDITEQYSSQHDQTILASGKDGNYQVIKGQSQSQSQQHHHFRGAASHPHDDNSNSHVCPAGSWCSTVESKYCKRRHVSSQRRNLYSSNSNSSSRVTQTTEQASSSTFQTSFLRHFSQHSQSQAQAEQSPTMERVCDWLLRQDLPGCLQGATVLCAEHSSTPSGHH